MRKPQTYEKTIGYVTVHASELFPRFVDINYNYGSGQKIRGLTIAEVRDLQYMLSQVLELAARDED